jgi:hypothetical protein
MNIRNSRFAAAAFLASGPVSLLGGQTANACAVNPEDSPMSVLIALLAADNGNLLGSRRATLQPGTGACVAYTRLIAQRGDLGQQLSRHCRDSMRPNRRVNSGWSRRCNSVTGPRRDG